MSNPEYIKISFIKWGERLPGHEGNADDARAKLPSTYELGAFAVHEEYDVRDQIKEQLEDQFGFVCDDFSYDVSHIGRLAVKDGEQITMTPFTELMEALDDPDLRERVDHLGAFCVARYTRLMEEYDKLLKKTIVR